MAAYTKTVDFAAKDSLASGDASKIVKGSEIGTEFDNIQTGFTLAMLLDGSQVPTGNLPMGGFKLTNLAAPSSTGDSLAYGKAASVTTLAVTGVLTVSDSNCQITGSSDATKIIRFEADGLTTGTTRVITAPDYDVTLGNIPAGVVMDYAGSSVPTGWLECDGSAVSRTTYANLFTAISTTWGAGDGATTFNLPDFRGRTRIGKGTGTVQESVTDANVSVANDTFTVAANNTKWITGMAVQLTTTTTLPTGLALATTYYVIRGSSTTIKFASSLANAQNGTAINITGVAGSGTHTVTCTLTARALGEGGGEESHAMSSTELVAHLHTVPFDAIGGAATTQPAVTGSGNSGNSENTGSTGGNAAMNIMQPFGAVMTIIKY